MNSIHRAIITVVICYAFLSLPHLASADDPVIWIVYFNSKDCLQCDGVSDYLKSLKKLYSIRIKTFDVEDQENFALLKRLEAIHSTQKFSVPLILIDETVLVGPGEITNRLESLILSLVSTGAKLPYLGPQRRPKQNSNSAKLHADKPIMDDCKWNKGRPPQVGDELTRIKSIIRSTF